MPADIFIYALVAAGLLLWLRSILGTRHGEERQRQSRFPASNNSQDPYKKNKTPLAEDIPGPDQKISLLTGKPDGIFSIAPEAKAGLIEILQHERDFDVDFFLDGAREAFVMIVEAFAKCDRETLQDLLSPALFKTFSEAIGVREKRGERQEIEIHAVHRAEIQAARMDNRMAHITVKFIADETGVMRDAEGEIIGGQPGKIMEMRDVWIFGRALRSRDPRWLVYETRDDSEGVGLSLPPAPDTI